MAQYTFNRVELEAPENWLDMSVLTLVGDDEGAFRPNIVVTREELDSTPDVAAYAREQSKELKKRMKKYVLHREEATAVGSRNGYVLEHSFSSPERVAVRQLQVYTAQGNTVFTASFTHAEDKFESVRDVFAAAARSLRIRG